MASAYSPLGHLALHPLVAPLSLDLGHLGLDRSHAPGGDRHPLDVAEVNAERLVLGTESVDVHGLADLGGWRSRCSRHASRGS